MAENTMCKCVEINIIPNCGCASSSGNGEPGGTQCNMIYSTEEQVVGTWVNGKSVYRKTWSEYVIPGNNVVNIDISALNIDTVVSINGMAYRPGVGNRSTCWIELNASNAAIPSCTTWIDVTAGVLILAGSDFDVAGSANVILEYTKTSD